ncbi:RCC1 domain-containing protein [Actinomadura sp. WMMA1423]|uniref:RCC1 domain-containing protein n=1 Tax=Actinomadura sp. WMMA1423 TaxID=2591108 RepID=UPI0011468B7E|nr:RCC1 domain-containing protein [Actinomadura sp. WMMA1423]
MENDRIGGVLRAGRLACLAVMTVIGVGMALLAPVGAVPVPVPAQVRERIDAGIQHTCVVDDAFAVRCWGSNDRGQLGHGRNALVPSLTRVGDNEAPSTAGTVDLGGNLAWKVATGGLHSCAVLVEGGVVCWGQNQWGVLGSGDQGDGSNLSIGDDEEPADVAIGGDIMVDLGRDRTAKAIAAGGTHTCVINDLDNVMCWGMSDKGQLGYPNTDEIIGDDEDPDDLGAVDLGHRTVRAIAAGEDHTCAVTDSGAVYCWGDNGHGQLGLPQDLNNQIIGDDETPLSAGHVDLDGMKAVDVTAGRAHTCATLEDATLRCWGDNTYGATGLGTPVLDVPPDSGPVGLGERRVTTTDAGYDHTCTALTGDVHHVWCWGHVGGQSKDGRLGLPELGTFEDLGDDEPLSDASWVHLNGDSVVALAAGTAHTCAVTTAGEVRCWGDNAEGALGNALGRTNMIGDGEPPGAIPPIGLGATVTWNRP